MQALPTAAALPHLDEVGVRIPRRSEAVVVVIDEKSAHWQTDNAGSRALGLHYRSDVVQMQEGGETCVKGEGFGEHKRFNVEMEDLQRCHQ